MVLINSPPNISDDRLSLFYTVDYDLSSTPILIFYGPATGVASSSRVQSHVFTPAGLQSYPRLAISPSSPLYVAVNCLSRQEQGDEVCRALAYSLFKYFSELPEIVKDVWRQRCQTANDPSMTLKFFSERHAAELASRMTELTNGRGIAKEIENALGPENISAMDIDVILPRGTVFDPCRENGIRQGEINEEVSLDERHGKLAPLIQSLGDPLFIPTSKMRRAPSRPTAVNRSATFSRSQKENIRRELVELVDTEENYVDKLDEIINDIGKDLRAKLYTNKTREALEKMFPPSLNQMLEVNASFMADLRIVLEETEGSAIEDIASTGPRLEKELFRSGLPDPTGISKIATCMLNWFPKFSDCYAEYIRANSEISQFLRTFMNENSSFAKQAIQDVGEQRLMSLLIEPIQRLPRYSLYIENITKQLPLQHPALKHLMKAKDLVTDICSNDQGSNDHFKMLNAIKRLVSSWPYDYEPQSRLIAAADLIKCNPPFRIAENPLESDAFIACLFADSFVLLRKNAASSISARGLCSEIDGSKPIDITSHGSDHLTFVDRASLTEVDMREIWDSSAIKIVPTETQTSRDRHSKAGESLQLLDSVSIFQLTGSYEGRASRLVTELVTARIEGRFADSERLESKWQARQLNGHTLGLSLSMAIFEQGTASHNSSRKTPPKTRIVIHDGKDQESYSSLEEGDGIAASASIEGEGFFKLRMSTTLQQKTQDLVTASEFAPVLLKRLSHSLQMYSGMRNPIFTSYYIQHNESILGALSLPVERRSRSQSKTQSLRQHSPVKTLSKLFGATTLKEPPPSSQKPTASELFNNAPIPRPSLRPKSFSQSQVEKRDKQSPSQIALVSDQITPSAAGTIEGLEQTFGSYVLALHARKGNVVSRSISGRAYADETRVNELYNILLEQPTNHEDAAQAAVDVLFASFEKFLKNAWKERLGPVLSYDFLSELQVDSETLSPIDFEELLLKVLSELAPQNRRAFRGVVALTVDLLDGMGNDGDRGALVAALTEILVPGENTHGFMPLFDRLVEEHDIILRNESRSGAATPLQGSLASSNAARSTATGSFSSKASSLSRRLGFGSIQRENISRVDSSKVGSIMRTWSKASRVPDTQARRVPSRTPSTDLISQASSASRPKSRDKDLLSEVFEELRPGSQSGSRPGTGRSWDQLDTVKESVMSAKSSVNKPKRTSSLSDISGLPLPNTSPFWGGTPSFRRPEESPLISRNTASTPLTSPSSPLRSNAIRHRSPIKKENIPPTVTAVHATADRPSSSGNASITEPPENTAPLMPRTNLSQSQRAPSVLPAPKGILSERPASGNTPPTPTLRAREPKQPQPTTPSPKKQVRPPTQTKLHTRLATQHSSITTASTSLQSELSKLGDELTTLRATFPTRSNTTASAPTTGSPARCDRDRDRQDQCAVLLQNLSTRLKALETRCQHLTGNLLRRNAEMERELAGKVREGEQKARELDGRLREANAENEKLYERWNEELRRIFERVEGGGSAGDGREGMEEMKKKLGEALEDGAGWKREVGRLRRENAVLKGRGGVGVE